MFYSLVEHWSAADSLYFCTMTLATVAFGDLAPVTTAGKMVTVVYVLVGVGTLVAFVSALAGRTLARQAELRETRRKADRP